MFRQNCDSRPVHLPTKRQSKILLPQNLYHPHLRDSRTTEIFLRSTNLVFLANERPLILFHLLNFKLRLLLPIPHHHRISNRRLICSKGSWRRPPVRKCCHSLRVSTKHRNQWKCVSPNLWQIQWFRAYPRHITHLPSKNITINWVSLYPHIFNICQSPVRYSLLTSYRSGIWCSSGHDWRNRRR